MPNIEIRGFQYPANKELKEKIDRIMQGVGLGDEAITDTISSWAESCDGTNTRRSYLRVCSTDSNEISKIISALKTGGIREDVEWLVLDGFIPVNEMVL